MPKPPKPLGETTKSWQLYWPLVSDRYKDTAAFARAVGVSTTTTNNWRFGPKTKYPLKNRPKLAELANVPVEVINEIFDNERMPTNWAAKGSSLPAGWREDVGAYSKSPLGRDAPFWVISSLLENGPGAFPWQRGELSGIHRLRQLVEDEVSHSAALGAQPEGYAREDGARASGELEARATLLLAGIEAYEKKYGRIREDTREQLLLAFRTNPPDMTGDIMVAIASAIEAFQNKRPAASRTPPPTPPSPRPGRKRNPPSSRPRGKSETRKRGSRFKG